MTSPLRDAARRAGPVAIAGIVSNVLGVVVTVGVARLLGSRDYGAMIQLFGVMLVLQMPGSSLLVAVVRRVTSWDAAGRGDLVLPWAHRVRRIGLGLVAVTAVVGLLVRGWAARELSLDGPGGVAEILVAGSVWGVLCVERGFLQSRLAFRDLAVNLGVEAGARTAAILALVAAGAGVTGAAVGVLAGVAVGAAHARVMAVRALHAGMRPVAVDAPAAEGEGALAAATSGGADLAGITAVPAALAGPVAAGRRRLLADAMTALAALALLAALQSLDVILLGREAPRNSGDYAAVSVSSKALVFLAIALAGYLLPEAATRYQRGEHALRELATALAFVAAPATVLVGIGLVAPRVFLAVFFGAKLDDASSALAPLALAMTFLAGTVLFTHYLLGVGRGRRVVVVLVAGAAVLAAAVIAADGRPVWTARADLACQAAVAVAVGFQVLRTRRGTLDAP